MANYKSKWNKIFDIKKLMKHFLGAFFSTIFSCLRDWRYLVMVLLFFHLFFLFFPSENWLFYQCLGFLFFSFLGVIFAPQRVFFLGIILLYLFFNYSFFFSKKSVQSFQKCNDRPEFLEAYLDKKDATKLILSKVYFFCEKQKYTIASTSLAVNRKYIPVYAGEKIRVLYPKISYKNNQWRFTSDKQTKFFPTKNKFLREQRGSLWQLWKVKSSYYLEGRAKELYQGIALADRSSLTRDLRKKISILGIFHLFAISGLHIGLIFLWVHFLWSKLFSLILLFLPEKKKFFSMLWADIFSLIAVWCYLYFIVFPITAVRAWIMLSIWIAIRHLLKWLPSLYILFLTALVMMIIHPSIIFSLSFQFSFLAVFSILVFAQWIRFTPTSLLLFYKNFVKTAAMTLVINLFTIPLTLVYFQKFNLLGFINNPFHIFFIGFVYLPLVLVGFVCIPLGLEQYYFWLMQKVGNFWYWIMEKNFAWSQFATYTWEGDLSKYFWLPYVFFLCILSILSFQKKILMKK